MSEPYPSGPNDSSDEALRLEIDAIEQEWLETTGTDDVQAALWHEHHEAYKVLPEIPLYVPGSDYLEVTFPDGECQTMMIRAQSTVGPVVDILSNTPEGLLSRTFILVGSLFTRSDIDDADSQFTNLLAEVCFDHARQMERSGFFSQAAGTFVTFTRNLCKDAHLVMVPVYTHMEQDIDDVDLGFAADGPKMQALWRVIVQDGTGKREVVLAEHKAVFSEGRIDDVAFCTDSRTITNFDIFYQ